MQQDIDYEACYDNGCVEGVEPGVEISVLEINDSFFFALGDLGTLPPPKSPHTKYQFQHE